MKDKRPYSIARQENTGGWYYDWPQILDDAEAGLLDEDALVEITRASISWVTCACGNQCAAIERDSNGMPVDRELVFLGGDFADFIGLRGWPNARATLAEIEARAADILAGRA